MTIKSLNFLKKLTHSLRLRAWFLLLGAGLTPVLIGSPARSFDQGWGDQGKSNFIVVEWEFGNVYGQGGGGGRGIPSINVKQVVTLSARIRLNGQEACFESREIGFLEGQEYPICGGIAIYKGGQTYFRIQNSPGIWVNSPSHCGGFPQSCRHYWNSNW